MAAWSLATSNLPTSSILVGLSVGFLTQSGHQHDCYQSMVDIQPTCEDRGQGWVNERFRVSLRVL